MKKTIKARFDSDNAARQEGLDRARLCAALSKPWVLPPLGHSPNSELPETYQSVGGRGANHMAGKMLLALFPPGAPWFRFRPAPAIRFDQTIPPDVLQRIEQQLYLHELLIQSVLESNSLVGGTNRRRRGFRTRKRMALDQIIITGDVLEQLTDDYRLKVFRRDQYVTKRDSSGDVLYHIVREQVDPLSLPPAVVAKIQSDRTAAPTKGKNLGGINRTGAKAPPPNKTKHVTERMVDLYTLIEWQPLVRQWLITQEIEEKTVNTSHEPISQYFSTAFELVPGEDYGRGFIELNIGDLKSFNELDLRMLDFAEISSKLLVALDNASLVREADLTKPTGTPIRARVLGGAVQDIALLKADKLADFKVVAEVAERKRKDLGKAMLLESETQPTGERVTRYQSQRFAMELDGALGGLYAPIADDQQLPLLQRTVYQLKRDRLMPPLPPQAVDVEATTGIAALSREIDAAKLFEAFQALSLLPNGMSRIDLGVAADIVMRQTGNYEPGLVKTAEQVASEEQRAIEQAAEVAAESKAIDVAGNIEQARRAAQIAPAPVPAPKGR